jgi:hypothetical protein
MLLKPIIEKQYHGLELYIGCKDETSNLFTDHKFIMKLSDLRSRRLDFGHIREINFDGKKHPVDAFAEESGLTNYVICEKVNLEKTNRCVILTNGNYPSLSLKQNQIDFLLRKAKQMGFDAVVNENIDCAGLVMGVECFDLFKAASLGIETKLMPTGLGTNLFQKMFPKSEILVS